VWQQGLFVGNLGGEEKVSEYIALQSENNCIFAKSELKIIQNQS
jgi:hypothetical protein